MNESESEGTKWTNGLIVKVSDSLDNVPNENVVTQLATDQPTDRPVTDQLLELLEWLFATKNVSTSTWSGLDMKTWSNH